MYCPACGADLPSQLKFCNRCGTQLSAQGKPVEMVVPSYQLTEMVKYVSTTVGIIGGAALILLFVFALKLLERGQVGEAVPLFLIGLSMIITLAGVFLFQWSRLLKLYLHIVPPVQSNSLPLPERPLVQPNLLPEPPLSVTEHTTKTLQPQSQYRERTTK